MFFHTFEDDKGENGYHVATEGDQTGRENEAVEVGQGVVAELAQDRGAVHAERVDLQV